MKIVYICSPYRDNPKANTKAAQQYCRMAYDAGEIPVAPHLYLPQFLDDDNEAERAFALRLGLRLLKYCAEVWVFGDKITDGMRGEIEQAQKLGKVIKEFPAAKIRKSTPRAFVPPTLEEVTEYIREKGFNVDAKTFYEFFTTPNSKGETWVDSKGQPVRNWKQKLITWNSKGGHARASREEKTSYFMNYKQRRYSDGDIKKLGLDLLGEFDEVEACTPITTV